MKLLMILNVLINTFTLSMAIGTLALGYYVESLAWISIWVFGMAILSEGRQCTKR